MNHRNAICEGLQRRGARMVGVRGTVGEYTQFDDEGGEHWYVSSHGDLRKGPTLKGSTRDEATWAELIAEAA